MRFDGTLYACNAPFFKRRLYELINIKLEAPPLISFRKPDIVESDEPSYKYVVLDCSPFNFIDTVGVKALIEVSIIHENSIKRTLLNLKLVAISHRFSTT